MISVAPWGSVLLAVLLSTSVLAATANAQEAENDESAADAENEPGEDPATEQVTLQHKSNLYLSLAAGLGYAALSEDRSSAKSNSNASEVSATGLGLQVYGAVGYRITPKVALGGAFSIILQPSPSIDYQLIGTGTPVVHDGGALGGFVGPMLAFQVSESFELNAAVGYGGLGRSSPNPGFGGTGALFSVAGDYRIPASPSLAITVGLRLTAGVMSHDGHEEGTYSSTLIVPALMVGFAFR